MKDSDIQAYIQMANFQAVLEIIEDVVVTSSRVVKNLFQSILK